MEVAFFGNKTRCISKSKPIARRQIKLNQITRPYLCHFETSGLTAKIREVTMVFTPDHSPVFNLVAPNDYTVHDVSPNDLNKTLVL